MTDEQLQQFEAANAEDGWLGGSAVEILIESYRTLQHQNKQLIETLTEATNDFMLRRMFAHAKHYEKIVQSIRGGTSHATSNHNA